MDLPCYLLSPEKQRNNLSYKLVLTSQTITILIIEVLIQTYYGFTPISPYRDNYQTTLLTEITEQSQQQTL